MNHLKNEPYCFTFISDPGHGWLEVSYELLALILVPEALQKISRHSYQDSESKKVYLEEDCDAGIVLASLKEKGIAFKIDEIHCHQASEIRNLDAFCLKEFEAMLK